jgi:signal transduction histidine kinase
MFPSLRTRLLFSYLLITGLVLAIVGISLLLFLVDNPLTRNLIFNQLGSVLQDAQRFGQRGLLAAGEEVVQAGAERLDQRFNLRFLVLDPHGEVIADSRPQAGVKSSEAFAASGGEEGQFRGEFADEASRDWLFVGSSLPEGRSVLVASRKPGLFAVIATALRTGRTVQLEYAGSLLAPVIQAAAVGLLVSLLLAWLISRWVAAPLQRMSAAATEVAAGDYRQKIPLEGPHEVQSLAATFNAMVEQVQTSHQVQRDFLANVSHELKTPLTSIQGFAQAMLDGATEDRSARQRAAQVIFDEAERLRRLVEDLLDLARIDAGQIAFEREPVDLKVLIENIIDRLVLRSSEKGIRLESRMTELPVIIGDGDRLAQVFTNLIDNAIKHTPKEGVVLVLAEVTSGWASIHVADTGPGIPSQDLSRIFERFYQVDKARRGGEGRGVGLGLAISRQIIEAHGGRIVAQSTVGKGSRFTVQLPVVRPDDETLARPQQDHGQA